MGGAAGGRRQQGVGWVGWGGGGGVGGGAARNCVPVSMPVPISVPLPMSMPVPIPVPEWMGGAGCSTRKMATHDVRCGVCRAHEVARPHQGKTKIIFVPDWFNPSPGQKLSWFLLDAERLQARECRARCSTTEIGHGGSLPFQHGCRRRPLLPCGDRFLTGKMQTRGSAALSATARLPLALLLAARPPTR